MIYLTLARDPDPTNTAVRIISVERRRRRDLAHFCITDAAGQHEIVTDLGTWARQRGMCPHALYAVGRGLRTHHHGYRVTRLPSAKSS